MKTEKPDNMITLICNAYTYLEFNKSFNKYYSCIPKSEFESEEKAREHWNNNIIKAHRIVSVYMKPSAIKQAQALIMEEF